MDIFQKMVDSIFGDKDRISEPTFTKPYIDKTYDMLQLALQLDNAPEESKQIFRAGMESMAAKIKAHQAVHDVLEQSKLPILILYDLHISCPAGSAAIDYAVISNRFVIVINCISSKDIGTGDEHAGVPASEHSAEIMNWLLKKERLNFNREMKEMRFVWPITVLSDVPQTPAPADDVFSAGKSGEVRHAPAVSSSQLVDCIRKIFKVGDSSIWLANKAVYDISDMLLSYDKLSGEDENCQKG